MSDDNWFENTNRILWWSGWRLPVTMIIGVVGTYLLVPLLVLPLGSGQIGLATSTLFVGTLLGVTVSAGTWFLGTRRINDNAPEILDKFRNSAPDIGRKHLSISNESTTEYSFEGSVGSSFAVDPAERYRVTTVLVGDSSVAIHGGVYLDMKGRQTKVGRDTTEFYFDQITSVSYQDGELIINSSDGESISRGARREPTGLVTDLQQRVREYKTA